MAGSYIFAIRLLFSYAPYGKWLNENTFNAKGLWEIEKKRKRQTIGFLFSIKKIEWEIYDEISQLFKSLSIKNVIQTLV